MSSLLHKIKVKIMLRLPKPVVEKIEDWEDSIELTYLVLTTKKEDFIPLEEFADKYLED